jgi:hypothetical protein
MFPQQLIFSTFRLYNCLFNNLQHQISLVDIHKRVSDFMCQRNHFDFSHTSPVSLTHIVRFLRLRDFSLFNCNLNTMLIHPHIGRILVLFSQLLKTIRI